MAQTQIRTRQDARDAVESFVDALSAPTLLRFALALQRGKADPERLARKVVEATDQEQQARHLPGGGLGEPIPAAQGKAKLGDLTDEVEADQWAASELLGAGEMAARLGVARTSLDNWRRARRALALRKGVRNYVYPVRQFERRAPVEGLDRVRAYFVDDEAAWEWLVSPNLYAGGGEPIEGLRKGELDQVLRAAEGAADEL